jgi:sec-independent protein translocase protein TatC
MESEEATGLTFWEHIGELRSRILTSVLAIIIGSSVAHFFNQEIIDFLLWPVKGQDLTFLSPLDPLFLIIKVDLFAGLIIAFPFICLNSLLFIRPALKNLHWLVLLGLIISSTLLLIIGLAYAYFVVAPISIGFLLSIKINGIQNMITVQNYLSFFLTQSFVAALIFQIPLVTAIGAYFGLFSARLVATKRRYIYLVGLVTLAIITPTPDVFNLAVVAIPTMVIFEGSLIIARVVEYFSKSLQ